jgi:hypothetical protein
MNSCCECKEEVKDDATRCPHCGAYQNWRRHLGAGVIVPGFVLTLVSIWAAPPVTDLLATKRAEVAVSILEGDALHTTFLVANTGNQPAGLSDISVDSALKGTWYLKSDLDKKLLEPGKAYVVTASNGSLIPEVVSHEILAALASKGGVKKNCTLMLGYVQMNGTKEILNYPFACIPHDPSEVGPPKIAK